MSQLFRRSQNDQQLEKGQGLVEYALILVLVAVVVIAVLSLMGPSIGNIFSTVQTALIRDQYCQEEVGLTTWYVRRNDGYGYYSYQYSSYTDPGFSVCS
jgi:pilus assembly protein Flp/PilA